MSLQLAIRACMRVAMHGVETFLKHACGMCPVSVGIRSVGQGQRIDRRLVGVFLLLWAFGAQLRVHGAVYYVSTNGSDEAVGSLENPLRTVQAAADRAQPGDEVKVMPGVYDERITTTRGGSGELARVTFDGGGGAVVRGWVVAHPFVTVRGFTVTGHSHRSASEAAIRVGTAGSAFILEMCRIINGTAFKKDDILFRAPNRIESASGDFTLAGFRPGMAILVMRGTNVTVTNQGTYTITSVSNHVLTVAEDTIRDEGPKPVYISGSPNYAVLLADGTEGCLIRGNIFSNLSYRFMFIQGRRHVVEGNIFEQNNGWDLLFWAGTNHVIRSNVFRNLGWGVYEPSPDIFDNWPVRYENIEFTHNMVLNMIGVINAQKRNATVSGPLFIRNNVFVDTGWLSIVMPNTVTENNTFVRVAKTGNVAVQVERHPVIVQSDNYATNVVLRNNIFVDCGQATGPTRPNEVGWYRFTGSMDSAVVGGNFVAGGPPDYAPKAGWPESPMLNGGDPGFVNMVDPLGPDGLPFTADDGLRLRPDSRLLGAGAGGVTVGAYELPYVERVPLVIERGGDGKVVLRWPRSVWEWRVETARNLSGPWTPLELLRVENGAFVEAEAGVNGDVEWFRLTR